LLGSFNTKENINKNIKKKRKIVWKIETKHTKIEKKNSETKQQEKSKPRFYKFYE